MNKLETKMDPCNNTDSPSTAATDAKSVFVCRKRTCSESDTCVSVDFSAPCPCCVKPAKKQRTKSNQQRTFVSDLKALADFLKGERKVLNSNKISAIEEFYKPFETDTELVKEWKISGSATMLEKLKRLEDFERKFGAWENHFG